MNTEKHHYLKNFVNNPWVQGVVGNPVALGIHGDFST